MKTTTKPSPKELKAMKARWIELGHEMHKASPEEWHRLLRKRIKLEYAMVGESPS